MAENQNTSDSSVKTAEVKAGSSIASYLGKNILPIIIIAVIAFFVGNNSAHVPIGFNGCRATHDSSSATGTIKTDSITHGVVIPDSTNFDSIVKHRSDSLAKIKNP